MYAWMISGYSQESSLFGHFDIIFTNIYLNLRYQSITSILNLKTNQSVLQNVQGY